MTVYFNWLMIIAEHILTITNRKEVTRVDTMVFFPPPNHISLVWGKPVTVTVLTTVYNLGDPVHAARGDAYFGHSLKPGTYRGYFLIVLCEGKAHKWIAVRDSGDMRWKGTALNAWDTNKGVTINEE